MPLYIKDDATADMVAQLARKRGVSKQDAVRERIAAWRKEHPMPPPTGQAADKAFFDDCRTSLDDLCRRVGDDFNDGGRERRGWPGR